MQDVGGTDHSVLGRLLGSVEPVVLVADEVLEGLVARGQLVGIPDLLHVHLPGLLQVESGPEDEDIVEEPDGVGCRDGRGKLHHSGAVFTADEVYLVDVPVETEEVEQFLAVEPLHVEVVDHHDRRSLPLLVSSCNLPVGEVLRVSVVIPSLTCLTRLLTYKNPPAHLLCAESVIRQQSRLL